MNIQNNKVMIILTLDKIDFRTKKIMRVKETWHYPSVYMQQQSNDINKIKTELQIKIKSQTHLETSIFLFQQSVELDRKSAMVQNSTQLT